VKWKKGKTGADPKEREGCEQYDIYQYARRLKTAYTHERGLARSATCTLRRGLLRRSVHDVATIILPIGGSSQLLRAKRLLEAGCPAIHSQQCSPASSAGHRAAHAAAGSPLHPPHCRRLAGHSQVTRRRPPPLCTPHANPRRRAPGGVHTLKRDRDGPRLQVQAWAVRTACRSQGALRPMWA